MIVDSIVLATLSKGSFGVSLRLLFVQESTVELCLLFETWRC